MFLSLNFLYMPFESNHTFVPTFVVGWCSGKGAKTKTAIMCVFRVSHRLHVFKRSAPVTCFPALGTGHVFSTLGTGCMFSTLDTSYKFSALGTGYKLSALGTGYIFSALGTGYMFCHVWHRLHVYPRSAPVTCFPRLTPVTCFPALGTVCIFCRAWYGYMFSALGTGYMFSRAWHRLLEMTAGLQHTCHNTLLNRFCAIRELYPEMSRIENCCDANGDPGADIW